jgi:hypothetical protein
LILHKFKKNKGLETKVSIAAEHNQIIKKFKILAIQKCHLIKGMSRHNTLLKMVPTTELKLIAQRLESKSNKTRISILSKHIGQKKMILSICLCSQSLTGKN